MGVPAVMDHVYAERITKESIVKQSAEWAPHTVHYRKPRYLKSVPDRLRTPGVKRSLEETHKVFFSAPFINTQIYPSEIQISEYESCVKAK